METQLNLLVQLGTVFIIIFGLFVFMVGAVIMAEFIRRERTKTKEDDWWEPSKKDIVKVAHELLPRKQKGDNGE